MQGVRRPNGLTTYAERSERAAEHLAFLLQMRDAPVVPGVNDHLGQPVLDAVEYVDAAASALDGVWSTVACERLRAVVNLILDTNAALIQASALNVVHEAFPAGKTIWNCSTCYPRLCRCEDRQESV